ncbi:MAG: hypothetical protein ACRCU5_07565 [Rhizobiaceae bacterium]
MLLRILMLAVLVFASGCREQAGDEYVTLTGRIFIFNYRIAQANYVVTLAKLKPTPEGARVVGRFDDPAGGDRLVIEKKIWTNNDKIVLESEALRCVVKDKPYHFDVEIRGPDNALLQTLSGTIVSTLDQDVLPDRPMLVGPAYTRNPDLKGDPAGKIPGLAKLPCP